MEENKVYMKTMYQVFVLLLTLVVMMLNLRFTAEFITTYFGFILGLILLSVFKKKSTQGTKKSLFKFSLVNGLIGGAIIVLTHYIYSSFVDLNYMYNKFATEQTLIDLRAEGLSDNDIKLVIDNMVEMTSLPLMYSVLISLFIFSSLVISSVLSLVLKTKNK